MMGRMIEELLGAAGRLLAVLIAGFLIAACAPRSPRGTAVPVTAPEERNAGRAGDYPASADPLALSDSLALIDPLALSDSLAAAALAVARAAELTPADLAALGHAPPRLRAGGILFTYAGRGALRVFVAGSFNGWVPNQHELARRRPADTLWVGFVPQPPRGRYLYKFLIDGRRWVVDASHAERGGDGAGGIASVLVVP